MKPETIAITGVGATAVIVGIVAFAIVVTLLLILQSEIQDLTAEVQQTNAALEALANHRYDADGVATFTLPPD